MGKVSARGARDAHKMGKVRGRSLDSHAIGSPVIINETLCHGQHLSSRIRAACGYEAVPPASEWNQRK